MQNYTIFTYYERNRNKRRLRRVDFKKSVEGHLTYLRKLKDYTEERLEKMPEGSLRRKKTREKMYYYLKSGHQEFSLLKYPGLRDIYIEKEWLELLEFVIVIKINWNQ